MKFPAKGALPMTLSRKIALSGILAALALCLSLLEGMLPLSLFLPLPGFRLGLSNIVTLVALVTLGPSFTLGVSLCRGGVLYLASGNFTSLFLSLLGALFSLLAMALAKKGLGKVFSLYGVSVIGAACHNVGQILGACILMKSLGVISYLPLLLILGLFTGCLNAAVSQICLKHLAA